MHMTVGLLLHNVSNLSVHITGVNQVRGIQKAHVAACYLIQWVCFHPICNYSEFSVYIISLQVKTRKFIEICQSLYILGFILSSIK